MRSVKLQSLIQSHIRQASSGSARKQRIALYSCHCETLKAHLNMRRSVSVHIVIIKVSVRNWPALQVFPSIGNSTI